MSRTRHDKQENGNRWNGDDQVKLESQFAIKMVAKRDCANESKQAEPGKSKVHYCKGTWGTLHDLMVDDC